MNEQRMIELETKMAYQEDSMQELSKVIFVMQKQINELELCCQLLRDKMTEVTNLTPNHFNANEKPPHY